MPDSHWAFLESCRLTYETSTHVFFHANYAADQPAGEQDEDSVLSVSLNESLPGPHLSGKTAVVGHTAQASGKILDLGYLKCIDTDCCNGGFLTAIDLTGGEVWQVRGPGRWGSHAPGRTMLAAAKSSVSAPPTAK